MAAADRYLSDCGSPLRTEDLTGTDAEELYCLVSEGNSCDGMGHDWYGEPP